MTIREAKAILKRNGYKVIREGIEDTPEVKKAVDALENLLSCTEMDYEVTDLYDGVWEILMDAEMLAFNHNEAEDNDVSFEEGIVGIHAFLRKEGNYNLSSSAIDKNDNVYEMISKQFRGINDIATFGRKFEKRVDEIRNQVRKDYGFDPINE